MVRIYKQNNIKVAPDRIRAKDSVDAALKRGIERSLKY
jgi:hypothetical protein